ncbi:MAG: M48 family metalloprotease [Gemmatimonadota bacterium]
MSRSRLFALLRGTLFPGLIGLSLLTTSACAVNPVTGEREFVLFTEDQEIQMGREADQDIVASLGEYDDPDLQAWVTSIAESMAADSERPDLPWTFRVLDDPTVNAFALPGGFIYVTRGIMAHLTSDAELAGILGHEIGHVTARHGVTRVSRAQLAQVGLGLGMILAPDLRPFGEAAGAGLQLLFLANSREAEREADDLGLGYMIGEDYDPRAVARVFDMLARASGAEDGERVPGFLSTHPDPLDRRDRILDRTTGPNPELTGSRDDRDAYLQRLEGMIFGADPRDGYFLDGTFFHPEMAFRMQFPAGWQTANMRTAVQGMSGEQDAAMILTIVEEGSPAAARDAFASGSGVEVLGTSSEAVNGLPAAWLDFRHREESGTFRGRVLFVRHENVTFRVLGYSGEDVWSARGNAITQALRSFAPVSDPAVLGVEPRRIELVRIDRAMTIEEFQRRYPSTEPEQTVGVINGYRPGETIPAGTLMKQIVGEGAPGT